MIGAGLDERLVGEGSMTKGTGAKLDSACRIKDLTSMTPGAKLDRDDRSWTRRLLSWSKASQLRTQEPGSTVPAGGRLNGPWSKAQQE